LKGQEKEYGKELSYDFEFDQPEDEYENEGIDLDL
jgi:hypothetical protein